MAIRFIKIPAEMVSMKMSSDAKIIYGYIWNGAKQYESNSIKLSLKSICEGTSISKSSAGRALEELEKNGLISIERSKPNIYKVLPFPQDEFPNVGNVFPNMGNKRLNMGNVFPNMGNECPNMGNSIPYIKEYRKEYKKRDVEKRARTREQFTYDADLFVKKKAEGGNK